MSHKACYLLFVILLAGFQNVTPSPAPPTFQIWFDCVYRGEYPGRAEAAISYRYDGDEPITAEDTRWFGDTVTGNTIVQPLTIEPGEHLRTMKVNVGALKVLTLKIILFSKIHVVTIWDNPEFMDCPLDKQPDVERPSEV